MSIRILEGDCRAVLAGLPDCSVNCCVTSPPYFGLRDYGVDGQIGLEANPEAFVAEMVDVFRDVHRVLRDDGTLWLNLGDSYANDTKWGGRTSGKHVKANHGDTGIGRRRQNTGLKSKDLIGIPWRVAFALQEDGWYLRQDIIWSKPNPMPESVTDRCTKAHEYIFLLTKSPKYFYDAAAIKEPASENTNARLPGNKRHKGTDAYEAGDQKHRTKAGLVDYAKRKRAAAGSGIKNNDSMDAALAVMPDFRNKRSVWTVGSEPFPEAHFATFPPTLIEPCIKAGCPAGGTVLDPFGGAGTTGLVADRLQRNAILIELNPAYAEMARRRIAADAGMFTSVAAQ
ncbi:site-specific DNA-methyltransferase [Mesorhizobium sp.]|uniref:DNA-methyltransferase n=1 Tax=Mesorhizobium sp. TaxID=1871066 RepID=UPI000FE896E3|nr:site-specific DNA-methyltransferase [Mesorhizobium sp.]RWB67612.1 MAG: site-specific DNA-methyltransferase [Mesorhizobium sp.]